VLASLAQGCLLHAVATTAVTGMLGSPVPRQRLRHLRVARAGERFQETLDGLNHARTTSGRGLVRPAVGPWVSAAGDASLRTGQA
jgi:hypothetical protein